MLSNSKYPNFLSVNSNLSRNDLISIKSSKNTGISRTVKISQLSRPSTIRDHSNIDDQCKVIKLIGDKHENIDQIMNGVHCVCGCKKEFKNILNLLMGKIYRLREERNQLKERGNQSRNVITKTCESIAIGTDEQQVQIQQKMREELKKLIEDSKMSDSLNQEKPIPVIQPLQTEQVYNLMNFNRLTSITFQNEHSESNLLEESPAWLQQDHEPVEQMSKLSFQNSRSFQSHILRQQDNNADNRLSNMQSYCKQKSLNIDMLENFIQKMNCAKQIGRYQTERRKKTIF